MKYYFLFTIIVQVCLSNNFIEVEKYGKIENFEYVSEHIASDGANIFFSVTDRQTSTYKIIATDALFNENWQSEQIGFDNSADDFELNRLNNLELINGELNLITNVNDFYRYSNISFIKHSIINTSNGKIIYNSTDDENVKISRSNRAKGIFTSNENYKYLTSAKPVDNNTEIWEVELSDAGKTRNYLNPKEIDRELYLYQSGKIDFYDNKNKIVTLRNKKSYQDSSIINHGDEAFGFKFNKLVEFRDIVSNDNFIYAIFHDTKFEFPNQLIIARLDKISKNLQIFETDLPFNFILNDAKIFNQKLIVIGKSKYDNEQKISFSVVALNNHLEIINYANWGDGNHCGLNDSEIVGNSLFLIGNKINSQDQDYYLAKFDLDSFIQSTNIEENNYYNSISMMPEPYQVQDHFSISLKSGKIHSYRIIDINSNIRFEDNSVNSGSIEINTNSLNRGIYFLELSTTQGNNIIKFIKN